jgi:hypothetical protein
MEKREKGELAEYAGEFVAFLEGNLVGHGPHDEALRDQVAEHCHVPPGRPAVIYVFSDEDFTISCR